MWYTIEGTLDAYPDFYQALLAIIDAPRDSAT